MNLSADSIRMRLEDHFGKPSLPARSPAFDEQKKTIPPGNSVHRSTILGFKDLKKFHSLWENRQASAEGVMPEIPLSVCLFSYGILAFPVDPGCSPRRRKAWMAVAKNHKGENPSHPGEAVPSRGRSPNPPESYLPRKGGLQAAWNRFRLRPPAELLPDEACWNRG